MHLHRSTAIFAAAWLLGSTAYGLAENDAQPTPDVRAAAPKLSSTHRSDKTRTKRTAAHQPADRSRPADLEPTDQAAERAASLERRRKAFFADKPEQGEPAGDLSSAPVGVTLGGSGGLTPEMGLKF